MADLHTGATESIIRPDVVRGKCEVLSDVRLRAATGESATVHGKTEVNNVFVIVDVVIMGADFMTVQGINLNMEQQLMDG